MSDCPDCGASPDSHDHLAHLDGCPIAAAIDRMRDQDIAWFAAHPHASEYYRNPVPGDLCLPTLANVRTFGRIRVMQLQPGVRVRDLRGVSVGTATGTEPSMALEAFLTIANGAPELPRAAADRILRSGGPR